MFVPRSIYRAGDLVQFIMQHIEHVGDDKEAITVSLRPESPSINAAVELHCHGCPERFAMEIVKL